MDCRLIFDQPASGSWNMAMDEALLESAGGAGQGGCLRFYQWDEPTLSLGYFQRQADRREHEASRHCPLVRRSTGGGAIIHDLELTYCFTTAITSHIDANLTRYYDAFHATLVEQLNAWKIDARLCRNPVRDKPTESPFLCFQRRTDGDVLLEEFKIAGSAQRRHGRSLLQHGSILLKMSTASPELAGIADLTGTDISPRTLSAAWYPRIADRLGVTLVLDKATDDERQRADQICRDKFESSGWTCRR
jgi:lipoate-protein ligase A